MSKHSLSPRWRCLGAPSDGSASVRGWEHHHDEADADTGSSGAAVISFQEQITFPAAKDMLGLNKNGNSQQIELGTGTAVVASPRKPLLLPAGSVAMSEEAEGCAEGCSSGWKAVAWRAAGKAPAPHILQDLASAPRPPIPCPDAHPSRPVPKAGTVCLQFPRRKITLKKLITHLKTKSACSSAHQG